MGIDEAPSPQDGKTFRKRWANISLRTLHLVGTAGVVGGVLFGVPASSWHPYLWLTLATGGGMLLLDAWRNAVFFLQVRGLAVVAKIALLACMSILTAYQIHILLITIVLSSVASHAPAKVRYFSIFHGREI